MASTGVSVTGVHSMGYSHSCHRPHLVLERNSGFSPDVPGYPMENF